MREVMVPADRRPSIPGDLIRDYLEGESLYLTQDAFAKRLGISRANLNAIINGKRAITPEMAMRLERVLGVSMQTWLNLQLAVDIYDATHSAKAKEIAKLKPIKRAV
jgi:addiction module HigA family antidote